MNPSQQKKAAAAAGAAVVGTSILKRSRLARLLVAGGIAAAVYTRVVGRDPQWHDVEKPKADA
jgi:hypothetical protein